MMTPHLPIANANRDLTEQLAAPLSQYLGADVSHVQMNPDTAWRPGAVFKIEAFDADHGIYPLVLKKQRNEAAYALYQRYLQPYQLNSPTQYGYITLDAQRFLVMDFVRHAPPNWADEQSYLRAVQWQIKKDLISGQHLDILRSLDCLGQMDYYGVACWLPDFERWHKAEPDNALAKVVWQRVRDDQNKIDDALAALDVEGAQTVVHGDLTLGNILFAEDEVEGNRDATVFVIDWTQPHISSVTKDLASLYDNAPQAVKGEVLHRYRTAIDFPHFEQTFAKAMLLRDIGYLWWMVGMINDGAQGDIAPSEVERVAHSLLAALGNQG